MSEKEPAAEPKQKTPKGAEIPVPKRDEFIENLKKVAPPTKRPKPADKPDRP